MADENKTSPETAIKALRIIVDCLLVLGILLTMLRVFGYIQLSWVWVLAPVWVPLALMSIPFLYGFFVTPMRRK